MKTIYKIIFFLTFVSASENASAINEWPVPTNVKLVIDDGKYKAVFGEPTYIDGGAYGWEAPAITRIGTWAAYGPPKAGGASKFWAMGGGSGSSTLTNSQVATKYAKSGWAKIYSKVPIGLGEGDPLRSCFTYVVVRGTGVPYRDGFPPGACIYPAPVPGQCNITTTDIILDHKTVTYNQMDGARAESSFNIKCIRSFTAKFSLSGGKKTLSIGGGTSTIKINDKPLLSNISLADGDNAMKISSTLSNVKPGTWQESAVLTMEYF